MMTMTGIGSVYGNENKSRYTSPAKEATEKQETEQAAGKKYANAQEYYDYLKGKYECLSATNYKVTISPAYLEKCVKDPKEAEELEKNLAHIPVSKRYFDAVWNALGAKLVNDELIFDENGNCGGSPNTYVTNNHSSAGRSDREEKLEKRAKKKSTLQNHYEKRKYLREQFEERQARKAQIRGELEERLDEKEMTAKWRQKSAWSGGYHTAKAMKQYEANILKG